MQYFRYAFWLLKKKNQWNKGKEGGMNETLTIAIMAFQLFL